ncbi:MAG: PIN domain-containing protein [Elusimicrobia bacterium]|nr:PIN domain-containing protein [Elusimicrobiota bacterium]
MTLLVDTGAFYALADRSDRNSRAAKDFFLEALDRYEFVTSSAVVLEAWTLIRNKLGWPAAGRYLDGLRKSEVAILFIEPVEFEAAARIMSDYADQQLSLTDAISFALMERHGIGDAFAFDKDFLLYRFGPRKQRSFTCWP